MDKLVLPASQLLPPSRRFAFLSSSSSPRLLSVPMPLFADDVSPDHKYLTNRVRPYVVRPSVPPLPEKLCQHQFLRTLAMWVTLARSSESAATPTRLFKRWSRKLRKVASERTHQRRGRSSRQRSRGSRRDVHGSERGGGPSEAGTGRGSD